MNIKKLGYLVLDYFTRTWWAFWGTTAFTVVYLLLNSHWTPKSWHWDEQPYLLLCMIITMLSYFQNIIIMTIQREDHEIQVVLEAKEAERDAKTFEMIEEIHEELVDEPERQAGDSSETHGSPSSGGQGEKPLE